MLRARTDPRATANGYNHTHFDSRGLGIPVLAIFPNDDEIDTAAKEAAEETESLLALLGISRRRLQGDSVIGLPPITSLHMGMRIVVVVKPLCGLPKHQPWSPLVNS